MTETDPASGKDKRPKLPPSWFIRIAWAVHRAMYRWTGGRRGLWRATPEKWGTFRLHSTGRRSGKERIAILGYHEDGANLVTVAMNGWMEGQPAWWVNLQAQPNAIIELKGERRKVRARAARPDEEERLWAMFPGNKPFVSNRTSETTLVVLEPRLDAS